MAFRHLAASVAALALSLSAPSFAAPSPATVFATVSPAPENDAFVTGCMRGRPAQTCVCMAQFLQRSGEGQFILEMAIVDAGQTPGLDKAAVFARHGIAANGARDITRAGKEARRVALGACR
jgi:hypothetical protein